MTDDLPFHYPSEPTVNVSTKRCYRHPWIAMHTTDGLHFHSAATCAVVTHDTVTACARCGKVRDEAVVRRNKNNRARGGSFERTIAKRMGGRKTGPLGGRDDVMVGEVFSVQTKRAQRFGLTEARQYLDDLRRTYPTRTPLVVHALPGERGGVVILTLESWLELHGPDGQKEAS